MRRPSQVRACASGAADRRELGEGFDLRRSGPLKVISFTSGVMSWSR